MFTHMCTNDVLSAEKQNWGEEQKKKSPRAWQILRVGLREGRENKRGRGMGGRGRP